MPTVLKDDKIKSDTIYWICIDDAHPIKNVINLALFKITFEGLIRIN